MKLTEAHRTPWDDRAVSILKSLRAAGYQHEQIAERLGRTKRAVRWKIAALGGRAALEQESPNER